LTELSLKKDTPVEGEKCSEKEGNSLITLAGRVFGNRKNTSGKGIARQRTRKGRKKKMIGGGK